MNTSISRPSILLLFTLVTILLFSIITPIQSSPLPNPEDFHTPEDFPTPSAPGETATLTSSGENSTPPPTTPSPSNATVPPHEVFEGDATYYATGLGACGFTNTDNDMIVALNVAQFGPGSNGSPVCNKQIAITCGVNTVIATIVDKCPGCGFGSLDCSPALFKLLAPLEVGRTKITWYFL